MESDVKIIKVMIKITLLTGLAVYLSGCAIPLLLGVKDRRTIVRADGSEETITHFITGADMSFGVSGTDVLNNNKGIKPNAN